ncbi:MAG: 23S rRNA (uracil(1939)-C(5))-methyltransferase RlmD [Clostridia bacterium]|nr:23S rRNA (uracil(1939)-C(5))-methyltransferase RlmD [Clostridia bacterium]
MKKNDLINLEIIDTTLNGAGVGRYDGLTVFVDAAVTGDVVLAHILKVKSNCAFAKVKEIITPSLNRVDAECGSYPRCGGCSFRHIDYKTELEIKENNVKNNLKRIGGVEPEFEPIVGLSDVGYRNKAQYPVSMEKGGLKVGFFSGHSHRVIDCPECQLQPTEFSKAVSVFKEFLSENNISVYNEELHKGLVRHIYFRKAVVTNEIMVCIILNGDNLPYLDNFIEKMKSVFGDCLKSVVININRDKTNVIMGKNCITVYGEDHITDVLCGVRVRISPLSFYQVNHNVAEKLYEKAAEYAEPDGKTVLDLYCGAGTIGLSMAEKAKKIIGVEIIPEAVTDAKFNAQQNGFKNTEFFCGDAAKAAEKLKNDGIKPDVIIVDPPRKGCEAELVKIITEDFAPEKVVYVSCDPATLARDCKLFKEQGYNTVKAATFDMFPRTGHVESVVKLMRLK